MLVHRLFRVIAFLAAGALLVLYLLPVVHVISLSVTMSQGLSNWRDLFEQRLFDAIERSLIACVPSAALSVAVGFSVALSWVEASSTLKRWVIGMLFLPLFVPETSHALAISDFLVRMGVAKGSVAVSVCLLTLCIPVASLILVLRANSIPPEVWKATQDMGIGRLGFTFRIFLPSVWPSLISAFMVSFLLAINEFTRTYFCSARELYSIYLSGVLNAGGTQPAYALALVVLVLGAGTIILLSRDIWQR